MTLNKLTSFVTPYILAVDDEPINRLILEDLIEDRYELTVVENGEACLQSVEIRMPDLILLDINMPGLSGFEVCKILKSSPATTNVPVIFLTAMIESKDERIGFKLGAVDYITKPFTESIVLARIKTHLMLSTTRQLLESNHKKLKQERDYFEEVILSMRKDKRFDRSNLQFMVSPVERSNGDIILSACNAQNHQHMLVGDFTGHGLNAAIAGPLVSSLFYTQMAVSATAPNVLEVINNELFRKLPAQCFLAAIYIDWDKEAKTVTIWNFGMPSAVIYNEADMTGQCDSMTMALGIVECCEYGLTPKVLPFTAGSRLFCYTDGMVEVANARGELYGDARVRALLKEISCQHVKFDQVLDRLEAFAEGVPIEDDVTLMELTSNG